MANSIPLLTELIHNLPWKKIEPSPGKALDIFRVATLVTGCIELVKLNQGLYRPHAHDNVDSDITVMEGNGVLILDGEIFDYNTGSRFYVSRGVSHGLGVNQPTLLFTIQTGEIDSNGTLDYRYT